MRDGGGRRGHRKASGVAYILVAVVVIVLVTIAVVVVVVVTVVVIVAPVVTIIIAVIFVVHTIWERSRQRRRSQIGGRTPRRRAVATFEGRSNRSARRLFVGLARCHGRPSALGQGGGRTGCRRQPDDFAGLLPVEPVHHGLFHRGPLRARAGDQIVELRRGHAARRQHRQHAGPDRPQGHAIGLATPLCERA